LERLTVDIVAITALAPVIPVLTIERPADAVPLARALVKGGLPVLEITLRTRTAMEALGAIAKEVPDAVVGRARSWKLLRSSRFRG
jgi:2-dehydro-3-deoxyphosphogluconate aldolase/(4S)-4-hydroxy-2-oxoglutarate aldolase